MGVVKGQGGFTAGGPAHGFRGSLVLALVCMCEVVGGVPSRWGGGGAASTEGRGTTLAGGGGKITVSLLRG